MIRRMSKKRVHGEDATIRAQKPRSSESPSEITPAAILPSQTLDNQSGPITPPENVLLHQQHEHKDVEERSMPGVGMAPSITGREDADVILENDHKPSRARVSRRKSKSASRTSRPHTVSYLPRPESRLGTHSSRQAQSLPTPSSSASAASVTLDKSAAELFAAGRRYEDLANGSAPLPASTGTGAGLALPVNRTECLRRAHHFFRLAALHGHIDAHFSLGYSYRYGFGVPRNDAEAVRCWRLGLLIWLHERNCCFLKRQLTDLDLDPAQTQKKRKFREDEHNPRDERLQTGIFETPRKRSRVSETSLPSITASKLRLPTIGVLGDVTCQCQHCKDEAAVRSRGLQAPGVTTSTAGLWPPTQTSSSLAAREPAVAISRLASILTEIGICYHLGVGTAELPMISGDALEVMLSALLEDTPKESNGCSVCHLPAVEGLAPRISQLIVQPLREDLRGTPDVPHAIRFYTIATRFGNATAACNLGYCHRYGLGDLTASERMALRLYIFAARKGHPAGLFNLGNCYRYGILPSVDGQWSGLAPHPNKAIALYREAGVRRGFVKALLALGELLMYGPVEASSASFPSAPRPPLPTWVGPVAVRDKTEALRVWKSAASKGSVEAMLNIGHCYQQGLYVWKRDPSELVNELQGAEAVLVSSPPLPPAEMLDTDIRLRASSSEEDIDRRVLPRSNSEILRRTIAGVHPQNSPLHHISSNIQTILPRNTAQAMRYYTAAADRGYDIARTYLAYMAELAVSDVDSSEMDLVERQYANGFHRAIVSEGPVIQMPTAGKSHGTTGSSVYNPNFGSRLYSMAIERRHEPAVYLVTLAGIWFSVVAHVLTQRRPHVLKR